MPDGTITPGACDIADSVRSGRLTALDVIESHLERIADVNEQVNAATVVFAEQARAAAIALDERISRGEDPGLLAGVPISVKENIDCAWSATTSGLPFAAHFVPPVNATFLQKMIDAGAIPVARGNMPDFGLRWDTDNDLFGRTLNPWDPQIVPEGSSGGDAVIVATGMAAIGLGNDYGGSLRLPASAVGVAALRPTSGRVAGPSQHVEPISMTLQTFATNGPIARSVADLNLAFSIMHGADGVDPLSITVPHPSAYEGVRRVAVMTDPQGMGVDPRVAASVVRAADALSACGWDVEEAEPPSVGRATELWEQLGYAEMKAFFQPGVLPGPLSAGSMSWYVTVNRDVPYLEDTASYSAGWGERFVIAAQWREFQQRYPIVLGPVSAGVTPQIGFDVSGHAAARQLIRDHRLTVAVSLLGLPSVAVPTGTDSGHPQGVQVIASSFQDHVALAAAADIERRLGRLTPIDPVQV